MLHKTLFCDCDFTMEILYTLPQVERFFSISTFFMKHGKYNTYSELDLEVCQIKIIYTTANIFLQTGEYTSNLFTGIFKYLREEENKDVRYGAVAMGGLTGFIFGLRGGILRVSSMSRFSSV